jgi:sulfide:quinone oxidoreductase
MPHILIAGGGVAAVEAVAALRALSGPDPRITMLAPQPRFAQRPASVATPFGYGAPPQLPLDVLARRAAFDLRIGKLVDVESGDRVAITDWGEPIPYDFLLVAIGARVHPAVEGAITFTGHADAAAVEVAVAEYDRLAFVQPFAQGWSLPVYELALMAAAQRPDARITVVTAEPEPLAAFGPPAGEMVRAELDASGIELVCGLSARVPSARIVELPHGRPVRAGRIVHLPGMAGPRLSGLSSDPDGFIRVGADLHVDDDPDVFAIGDGIAGPHKHGGLAALQADAVAREIAGRVGAAVRPEPYRPALHAVLHTEHGPRYLLADPRRGDGRCVVSGECLWWPPTKIASRWLTPWLAAHAAAASSAVDRR